MMLSQQPQQSHRKSSRTADAFNTARSWANTLRSRRNDVTFFIPAPDDRMTSAYRTSTRPSLAARRVLGTIALVTLTAGCAASAQSAQDLDYSRTRVSEAGLYRGTIRPAGDSIPQGKLQSWTLHLVTASGTPVDSAKVFIDGGMPQHGHGLPTKPQVTRSFGNGDHLVEGLKFNMGGWWVVKFHVSSPAGSDSLLFNLSL